MAGGKEDSVCRVETHARKSGGCANIVETSEEGRFRFVHTRRARVEVGMTLPPKDESIAICTCVKCV